MSCDRADPGQALEDPRRRTARRRRRETKQRLLTALFELIDRHGCEGVSVDNLRHECGLSRGAFYRYFPTLEAMFVAASTAIGACIDREMSARFDGEPDAALRMTQHARYFVERAATDRPCALLLLRTLPFSMAISDHARDHVVEDFRQAQRDGAFDLPDLDVAVELGHGVLLASLRRAVILGFDAERLSAAMTIMLRGFGLDDATARRMATGPMPEIDRSDLRALSVAAMLAD